MYSLQRKKGETLPQHLVEKVWENNTLLDEGYIPC